MRPSLDDLGLQYGTDKASTHHDYLRIYERELSHLRDTSVSLLELGWWDGASVKMWRDYFTAGHIAGLDIEPKTKVLGVDFWQGDQTDSRLLRKIADHMGGFDVVVDDASHVSNHTIMSFMNLWHRVKPGGYYFVEDLQVSYHKDWGGHPNPEVPGRDGMTIMQFLRKAVDDVHYGHAGAGPAVPWLQGGVAQVSFWPGLCMVKKAES